MKTTKIVSWGQDGAWLGYIQDYPDYWTQGESLEDLHDHLRDLYADLKSGVMMEFARLTTCPLRDDRIR